jgi:hypothetical protein
MYKLFSCLIVCLFLFSCSRRDDKYQEFVDDKSQTSENKENPKQDPKETAPPKQVTKLIKPEVVISPLEANQNEGKFAAVRGYVAEVTKRERVAYLNFVESYPKTPFTGVIFAGDFDKFSNLSQFLHKDVEVTGLISTYRNRPQIIINDESQIKIIK